MQTECPLRCTRPLNKQPLNNRGPPVNDYSSLVHTGTALPITVEAGSVPK
jgi:hypothetical protein